ncbi:MAG: HAD family phosphatase [Cyclobacteriaceae bacterium]
MSQQLDGIEGVIFDFGEVIIELDYPRVISGFSEVAKKNVEEIHELVVTAPLLKDFEVSKISPTEFRIGVNQLLGMSLDDDEFDFIWNSMLKNLPRERMDILADVAKRFNTFILSNSNVIHEAAYNKMIENVTGKPNLHAFVQKAYFSQDIGLRKPGKECYQFVIDDIGIDSDKLLFLDDRLDNIEGAQACGLNTVHVTDADRQLREIFKNG